MKAWLDRRPFFREGHIWHGLQLALSVVLAYGVSRSFGLPEAHWAVMSALIVSRADASATLGAGWQRLAATLGGALVGLAGAGLVHVHVGTAESVTLVLVVILCFATADRIGWRSSAITALIVMTAAGRPEVSPLTVASLRTLEIAVGAGAAMLMAWLAYRLSVTARPLAVISALLRQLATQAETAVDADATTRESNGVAVRAALRRLGEMVHGAAPASQQRKLLLLTMRLAQDVGWLARQASTAAPDRRPDTRAATVAAAVALRAAANRLDGASETPAVVIAALGSQAGDAWRADAFLTLQDDLRKLMHLSATVGRGDQGSTFTVT